ncbi:MAG TPA: hypothetical protein VFE41_20820 [Acetobacteraceae bacterium]|jgi:CHASE3 domain sensor protein|nr:hypothetical protein [Acetobacteraceae bacterium]
MLSSLNNLSIRNKVTVAFAMVIVIMIGLGQFAVQRLGEVNASLPRCGTICCPAA